MRNIIPHSILLIMLTVSCGKTINEPFTGLFNGEITPTIGGGGGGSTGISIVSTTTVNVGSNQIPGNIAYDGTRLLWMNPFGIGNCFAGDVATFQYMALDFTVQTTSSSTYTGASSTFSCNGRSYPNFATTAGQSAMFWITGGGTTGKISIRNDSTGTVSSTTNIDVSNYGCTTNDASSGDGPLITYCNGLYYGACTSATNFLRLFSTNLAGTMQSAVTTTFSALSYGNLNALTCYGGNSLLLVTHPQSIYKYDLSFNQLALGTYAASLPSGLDIIVGIATDGTNLYLQGAVNTSPSPPTVTFGKATLGNLQ